MSATKSCIFRILALDCRDCSAGRFLFSKVPDLRAAEEFKAEAEGKATKIHPTNGDTSPSGYFHNFFM